MFLQRIAATLLLRTNQELPTGGLGRPNHPWALVTGALGVMALLLNGCLSRPGLVSQSFGFSSPPVASAALPEKGPVLAVRRILVAAPFDNQSFVYRTGEVSYERDPYAGFLVPPAVSLDEPLQNYFRLSGLFRTVTEPGSALQPDLFVEISVRQLCGDFRNRAHPAAVLEIQFAFFQSSRGTPGTLLLEKNYSERVPLKARTAQGVMEGWNIALKEIVGRVVADLKMTGPFKLGSRPNLPASKTRARSVRQQRREAHRPRVESNPGKAGSETRCVAAWQTDESEF